MVTAADDVTNNGLLFLNYRLVIVVHVDSLLCLFLSSKEGSVAVSRTKKNHEQKYWIFLSPPTYLEPKVTSTNQHDFAEAQIVVSTPHRSQRQDADPTIVRADPSHR